MAKRKTTAVVTKKKEKRIQSGVILIRTLPSLKERIQYAAKLDERTVSEWSRRAIEKALHDQNIPEQID